MRRSPRRPLILKRRKLPFQQNEPAGSASQRGEPESKHAFRAAAAHSLPDGIRIMDHPSMSDTQVVVIPKTADLQSVIGALTAKGKESGAQGPTKFILLSGSDASDNESFCQPAAGGDHVPNSSADGPLVKSETALSTPEAKSLSGVKLLNKEVMDDSLTNIQWLGKMSTCELDEDAEKHATQKENITPASQCSQVNCSQNTDFSGETAQQPTSERPPYSYMAMIQFAINSRSTRMMTLKEIYMWIEDHFPYYKDVAKPGWKNSIRHNLSLHDMFIRETSLDGKVSYWTIRPEANRCLTLDQVYKAGCDPMTTPVPVPMLVLPHQQQKRILPDTKKTQNAPERRMKPLLPRTDSYFVPIQLPVASSLYLPSSSPSPFTTSGPQQKQSASRSAKRVRIAPKVAQSDAPPATVSPSQLKEVKVEPKQESEPVPIGCETPKAAPKRQASSSRRKQSLARSLREEPVLLCPDNTFLDSGVASDTSMEQDVREAEPQENQLKLDSPDREFSFKTPIKSSSHLTSSTPSKPPCSAPPEPWRVTPVSKRSQSALDFSPIRTPSGPALAPWFDYTTLSFNSTPFKEWPLFNSSGEQLTSPPARPAEPSGELLQPQPAGASAPSNRSVTEGLVLDTLNDSLSKILVDISFPGLDEDELSMANISWSDFFPQLK